MNLRLMVLVAVVATVFSSARSAPAQNLKEGEFSVQRFSPAPGPRNFINVAGARTDGKMAFSLGLFGNYGNEPLLVTTCVSSGSCTAADASRLREIKVVETIITGDLLASLTIIPELQLGLRVPYTFTKGLGLTTDPNDPGVGQAARNGLKGSGLGDPLLEVKGRVYGKPSDMHVVGVAVFGTAPIAHAVSGTKDTFIGDTSPTFGGRVIYDLQLGRFNLAGNVGGAYRQEGVIGATRLGTEFRYGAGAGFLVSPVLTVLAEGFGATSFTARSGTDALEAALALRLHPLSSKLVFTAGAGTGVIMGAGVPSLRVFAGAAFVHEPIDQDGDGIGDDRDQCPTAAEDRDGFQDQDGCPDPDNDGDGFPDGRDKCPNEAEVKNGFQDDDGCPDDVPDKDADGIPDAEDKCPDDGGFTAIRRKGDFYGCPDSDKDGLADKLDKCPNEPEDTDGYQDADGCPEPDNDGDGINDSEDQCIDQPEVANGFQDDDGCPDEVPDRDKDGIPDSKDKCPDQPENFNGFQDDDGCADKGPTLAEVTGDEIKIRDVVNFGNDSDQIIGARSFQVLDAVAALLVHHPEIFQIEIAGHTDNKGDAAHNTDLSKRRAASVVAYVTGKGVDAKRLSSAGYGPDKPIADNKSAVGRGRNRRVEFRILSSTKKPAARAPTP